MKSIVLTPRLERLIFPAVELRYKGYTMSLLLSGSKILSIGRNTTLAPQSRFRPLPSIHAELDAIRKSRFYYKKKITMIIIRRNKSGEWINSRPCAHCIETLQKNRISQIIYSNQEGKFTKENVNNMDFKTAHVSLGWQKIQKLI